MGRRGLFYLPSLAFPPLTAFPYDCFQRVTALKEIKVMSAFDRAPRSHTATLDPGELPRVNVVACLCSRVSHSLYLSQAYEYLSCQIYTYILKT